MASTSKSAIVTGGISGLGEACTLALLRDGYAVVAVDTNKDKGEDFVARMAEENTYSKTKLPTLMFAKADVRKADEVQAAVDAATELGELRVVVNSAGVGFPGKVVTNGKPHPLPQFETVVGINLIGTFNVTRLAAAAMVNKTPEEGPDNHRGVIINVASVAAYDGQIGQAAYSASKAGVVGMTLPMARELGKKGIRINTIAPGIFETPMTAMATGKVKEALANDIVYPKRLGTAPEFAQLAMAIVRNRYLNGETIRLDGAARLAPAAKL